MPVESCLSGLRGASVNPPRCSSGKILKPRILWHSDDDTQPPASSHAELAGKIQLSLRSPSEDDDLEVSCKARVPLLYPLMISESFPHCPRIKTSQLISQQRRNAFTSHRSLSELGPCVPGRMRLQTDFRLHASFMGEVWQLVK